MYLIILFFSNEKGNRFQFSFLFEKKILYDTIFCKLGICDQTLETLVRFTETSSENRFLSVQPN